MGRQGSHSNTERDLNYLLLLREGKTNPVKGGHGDPESPVPKCGQQLPPTWFERRHRGLGGGCRTNPERDRVPEGEHRDRGRGEKTWG